MEWKGSLVDGCAKPEWNISPALVITRTCSIFFPLSLCLWPSTHGHWLCFKLLICKLEAKGQTRMKARLQLINHWLNNINLTKVFHLKRLPALLLILTRTPYYLNLCTVLLPKGRVKCLLVFASYINSLMIYNKHYQMAESPHILAVFTKLALSLQHFRWVITP